MHDTERPRASARRGAIADLEAISRRVQPERESSRAVTPAFVVPKSCPEKPKTSLSYDRAVTRSFFALRKPSCGALSADHSPSKRLIRLLLREIKRQPALLELAKGPEAVVF